MKAKINVSTEDTKKALVAASWADVKILKGKPMGPKTALELQFNDPNKLVDFGGYMATLTGDQVKAEISAMEAAKKEAAEKADPKTGKK